MGIDCTYDPLMFTTDITRSRACEWLEPRHVDSDQAEVRSAALDAVEACYIGLDMDSGRIHRLLGAVNDKTKTLIDEVRTPCRWLHHFNAHFFGKTVNRR